MAQTMLFGSAMSTVLPPGASDCSRYRQVPDNQEVYTHSQTDQSIIIEILEYVEQSDLDAIRTHFRDLAEGNGVSEEDSAISQVEQIQNDKLLMPQCGSAWYILGHQNVAKYNEAAKNTINIHMGLFRLPQYTSDILITFNDPAFINPESSSAQPVPASCDRWTVDDFKQVLISFSLLDPGLFGEQ